MEDNTLAGLTKRIKQVDSGAVVVDQDTTVILSNTLTGIQNAFNKILTYSKNMNRIQEAKLEDAGLYNKEAQLEAPRAVPINAAAPSSATDSALVSLIPDLLKVVKKLDKELQDFDTSDNTNLDPDLDIDNNRRRTRSRGRVRGGNLAKAGRFAKGAAITAAGAYAIDAGFGMFGVGKNLDQKAIDTQDDANWERMSLLNKAESGVARGMEEVGELFFLDNIAAQAKASRVETETAYLDNRDKEKNPKADRVAERNKAQSDQLVKAATTKAQAVPVRKPEPTKAMSKQGSEWTGKVSMFIGDTYRNVSSFMGGFLAKLASLGSQLGGFLSGGAESLAGMFGFGGGAGFQEANVAGVKGAWAKDTNFIGGVNQLAQKWDIDSGDLLGLFHSESGVNAQARNPSGATGIIQFMPDTARALGTSTDAIYKMNKTQQLALVDRYFAMHKLPKGATAGQLYATVFLPAYNRKSENFVIARPNGPNDAGKTNTKWYTQNAGLDANRDGVITVGDLGVRLSKKRQEIGLGASKAGSGFRALGNLAMGAASSFGGAVYEAATSAVQGIGNFIMPVASARVTSGFGPRRSPAGTGGRGSTQHRGVDFGAKRRGVAGDPIYAAAPGIVTMAKASKGYGNLVKIDHGKGMETRYGHLSSYTTFEGKKVQKGEQVGRMGNTGVSSGIHLHFELLKGGTPIDPLRFLGASTVIRADPTATEPGNEQSLKPGQKPVARPTSELAQDAAQVAIDKKKQQQRSTSTSRGTPGRRPPQVVRGGGPSNKPQQQKKSTMGQFLSYFGAG